ncbi:DUF4328 domain-containing protein [Mycobacterium shimoidei]|uniref:DUF4328 domain-containing protein n=1 Tax=Mycobacterium shimoidei TaxID=29313 RepID=UPI000848ABD1|nr:DUF4328 domain-containing protein [Mycobacterium shimoidei]MCV7258898.1 DUF4328 domain-containing protein [Mycobacterium shimoidei]ODR15220.1 hypothetical protein BHQ16_00210 [Mycobacterium shimoidei]ORW79800.1 hypothetical protein AWC26_12805 [Mycobacterium shimoidei]
MIQVCSQCGTRWNVRDRQRVWCPRCRGTLLAPSTEIPAPDPRWNQRAAAPAARQRSAPRLPPGYRWIAVRPGPPPPPRRRRRPLGPTPRYAVIPRWGLADHAGPVAPAPPATETPRPSVPRVRTTLFATQVVLGIATLVYLVRYLLLIINRNTLLNPWVAGAAFWLGVLVGLAAIAAVITCAIALTQWLIARRAAAFAHYGWPEPRSVRALWAGCLVPLVNLAWAPVYVIELANVEEALQRLRKPILVWWIVWTFSTAVSVFAWFTSRAQDAQGIANNTVTMIFAYLLAAAGVATAGRVFEGFERKPVERPARRWVVVPDEGAAAPASSPAVELKGEDPAA